MRDDLMRDGTVRNSTVRNSIVRNSTVLALARQQSITHLADVGGDHDAQAGPLHAVLADRDDRGAVPCLLRAEVVAGKLGRQLIQSRGFAAHGHQLKYAVVL
jgi:hypothetical protein